ncbi:MAG: hypothetical protein HYY40_13820 [Bacteroidetes bacterium]|nr:hypothetical protein [Bacteroidota bacterium]
MNAQDVSFNTQRQNIGFYYRNGFSNAAENYGENYYNQYSSNAIYVIGTGFHYSFRLRKNISILTGLTYQEFGNKQTILHKNYYTDTTNKKVFKEEKNTYAVGFLSIPFAIKFYFSVPDYRFCISAGISLNHRFAEREIEYYKYTDQSEKKYYSYYVSPGFLMGYNGKNGLAEYTYGALLIYYSVERKLSGRWFLNLTPEFQVLPVFYLNGEKPWLVSYSLGLHTGINFIIK